MSVKIARISFPIELTNEQLIKLDEFDESVANAIEKELETKLNVGIVKLDGIWDDWDSAGWDSIDLKGN